jgi:Ser/Thr protein kinase RdoA (MazF antagonist)
LPVRVEQVELEHAVVGCAPVARLDGDLTEVSVERPDVAGVDVENRGDVARPCRTVNVSELRRLLREWDIGRPFNVALMPNQGHSSRAWLVETADAKLVAKLIDDGRPYVEPGLRVAAAVERGGVSTGAPVPTRTGEICTDVHVGGQSRTLALLRFVAGEPLDVKRDDAAEIAGDLLGRVHTVLLRDSARSWVPNDLLDWCEAHAQTNPESDTGQAMKTLTGLRKLQRAGALKTAVVYGDPSPEIIVTEQLDDVALIDWGTPSWGPLVHDIACWLSFIRPSTQPGESEPFTAAYERHVPLARGELDAIPLFHELARALRLWTA